MSGLKDLRNLISNSINLDKIAFKARPFLMISAMLTAIVTGITIFAQYGFQGLLVNKLVATGTGNTDNLAFFAIALILLQALPSLTSILENYHSKMMWLSLTNVITVKILEKKSALNISEHEDPELKDIIQRVDENGDWRMVTAIDRQFWILKELIALSISIGLLFLTYPIFFLIVVMATIPDLIVEIKYAKDVWGMWGAKAETRRKYFDTQNHFQKVSGVTELKLYQNTGHFINIIKNLYQDFLNEEKGHEDKKVKLKFLTIILAQLGLGIIIYFLLRDIFSGAIMAGNAIFVLGAIFTFRSSINSLFSMLSRQYQDNLFVNDYFTLMRRESPMIYKNPGIVLPRDTNPKIEFKNVSFKYPKSSVLTLDKINITINPGDKIALIGINGAGKTTLIKLLCRFYDPTEGQILINGHDLKDINLESWYSILGVLFQDYGRYNLLTSETIALGNTKKDQDKNLVKQAARNSDAYEFIEKWPEQYEQQLGVGFTGAVEPSVGQWQKLALARSYYRDPSIFILDEPTASIDAGAELKIFENLEKLSRDKTVILISHRFSTVRNADKIIVLKDKAILEQGTHEELLKMGGEYARLFNAQKEKYD